MAFLVATTSLPAVYRPNGYARTTTAGTTHARAKNLCISWLIFGESVKNPFFELQNLDIDWFARQGWKKIGSGFQSFGARWLIFWYQTLHSSFKEVVMVHLTQQSWKRGRFYGLFYPAIISKGLILFKTSLVLKKGFIFLYLHQTKLCVWTLFCFFTFIF